MKKILLTILLVLGIAITFQFTTGNLLHNTHSSSLNTNDKVVMLELFTSQGCSSCPSADRLLDNTLAEHDNVIGLSYHVDYWNYIGWKDPFSSKVYSNYQRAYSSKFNSSTIYTPQLVVNGTSHFTGSDALQLNKKLNSGASYLSGSININSIKTTDTDVQFTVTTATESPILTVVLVIEERQTDIPRGENRNKTLTNTNIVVAREVKSTSNGGAMTLKIPDIVKQTDRLKIIAFAQDKDLQVLAAAQHAL